MSGLMALFGRGLDQDWVDRANGFWSVLLLAVCSVVAFFIRYFSNPIRCFVPAQFEDSQVDYTLETCFMKYAYNAPSHSIDPQKIPTIHSYHLWIPVIIFMQALCFKIPNVIWETCKLNLMPNLDKTVHALNQAQMTSTETRRSNFEGAARLLKGNKFFVVLLYLFVKLLSCLNLLGQLVFITVYFRNALFIKAGSILNLDTLFFVKPLLQKVVRCKFNIQQVQNTHRYTVQCLLSITETYEKMYVVLWYWVFFLAVVTFFNLVQWAAFLFIHFFRNGRITAYINASPGPTQDSSSVTRFVSSLGVDDVFILFMISRNSSVMVAANLSQQMYQVYLEQNRPMPVPPTSAGKIVRASAPDKSFESIPMNTMNYCGDTNK